MLKVIILAAALLPALSFAKDTVPVKNPDSGKDTTSVSDPLEKDTTEVRNDGKKPGSSCELIQMSLAKRFSLDDDSIESGLGVPLNYFTQLEHTSGALAKIRGELNVIAERLAKKDDAPNTTGSSAPKSSGDPQSDTEKMRRKYRDAFFDMQKRECEVFVEAKKSLKQFHQMLSRRKCSMEKFSEAKKELGKVYEKAAFYFDKDGCKKGNPSF